MRLPIADDVVEWDLLLQVIWAGLAAGIGVTIAMSVAILGATRAADARRDGDTLDTIFYSALFVLGLAACAGAVVLGIVVMTSKD
jgi:F0F1-type ATP synthase membrane subunit c/vacuolar-type H+-ATPase subunit K